MNANTCSQVVAGLDGLAPAELLAVAGEAVRRAAGQPLSGRDGRGLVESVVVLHRLETRVHAEKLRRVAAVESAAAYRGLAMSSVGLWSDRLGLSRGEAKTLVEAAGVLQRMPGLAARHADGTLGASHVADAARTVAQLDQLAAEHNDAGTGDGGAVPARDEAVAALDELIVEQAASDAGAGDRPVARPELRRRLDEFTRQRAPGLLAERELRLRARRNLRLVVDSRDPDRVPQLLADLAPVTFAKAKAMIHALARQHAAEDPRTFAQRCHDAFERILDLAAATGELPDLAGEQPRVLLLVQDATLHDQPDAPAAELDGYGPVSNGTARQIAATRPSPPSRSVRAGRCSTSAVTGVNPTDGNAEPCSPVTVAASAAARRWLTARSTTSSTGSTAGAPTSATSSRCAGTATPASITATGKSSEDPTDASPCTHEPASQID